MDFNRVQANARRIGVCVRRSTVKGKKVDVFDKACKKKLASVGATGYSDFTQHKDKKRQKSYQARHNKHRHKKGTPSYFADKLLWR
jgi:hypothetical protein